MIENKDLHLNFIKKEPQTGSFCGMRYLLRKGKNEEGDCLETILWPEPFCFAKTPDSEKQLQCFPLTDDGLKAAVEWLNRQYEAQEGRWKVASSGLGDPPSHSGSALL